MLWNGPTCNSYSSPSWNSCETLVCHQSFRDGNLNRIQIEKILYFHSQYYGFYQLKTSWCCRADLRNSFLSLTDLIGTTFFWGLSPHPLRRPSKVDQNLFKSRMMQDQLLNCTSSNNQVHPSGYSSFFSFSFSRSGLFPFLEQQDPTTSSRKVSVLRYVQAFHNLAYACFDEIFPSQLLFFTLSWLISSPIDTATASVNLLFWYPSRVQQICLSDVFRPASGFFADNDHTSLSEYLYVDSQDTFMQILQASGSRNRLLLPSEP